MAPFGSEVGSNARSAELNAPFGSGSATGRIFPNRSERVWTGFERRTPQPRPRAPYRIYRILFTIYRCLNNNISHELQKIWSLSEKFKHICTTSDSAASHPSIPTHQRLRHTVGRARKTLTHGPNQLYSVFFYFWTHILLIFAIFYLVRLSGDLRSVQVRGTRPNRTEPNGNITSQEYSRNRPLLLRRYWSSLQSSVTQ